MVRWDPRTLYSKIFPNPAERDWFLSHVCTMDWHMAHDAGVSFADNRDRLTARFPEHAAAIAAWRERWDEMFSGPIPETETAIEAMAARGVPMFGLTNMPAEVDAMVFAMSPVFGHLKHIVVSAREGTVKPQPRIFEIVCERAAPWPTIPPPSTFLNTARPDPAEDHRRAHRAAGGGQGRRGRRPQGGLSPRPRARASTSRSCARSSACANRTRPSARRKRRCSTSISRRSGGCEAKAARPQACAAAKRAALNALKRARRAADRAGVKLSDWEGEFLGSVEGTRLRTYGRAFADPEKGAPGASAVGACRVSS
jgi:hypothetical protein